MSDSEIFLYVALGFGAIVVLYFLLRRKCPNCKKADYFLENSTELDRWVGSKEKFNSSKNAHEYITTTFVKRRYAYCCNNCGTKWNEIEKEELN